MGIRRSITDEIAGIPPDGSLFIEIARSRHPSSPCNGCDFRSMVSVCDYCECTQPIDVGVTTVAEIAAANGYVKLEPGQVVVQVEDLTRIVTWFKGDARTVPHTDMDTTLNRFAAALDAIKEARDE